VHYSLRIGLGTDSTHSKLQSFEDALNQYKQPSQYVGVRSINSMSPTIEPWPADMFHTLEERIKTATYYRKISEDARENNNLTQSQKDAVERKLRKLEYEHTDRLQLCHQAIYGADPARQRLIHFWLNHFTIGAIDSNPFTIGHVIHDTIGKGIGGSFASLAYDITRHPGMLSYLDNVYNVGEKSRMARNSKSDEQIGLNDNLARELMELHTTSPSIGYTEEDIRQAAKVLAGMGRYI